MKRAALLLAGLAALAACATPEQECINAATRDLTTVNALIEQSEENLRRGYAVERQQRVSPRLTFCTGYRDNVGISFCTGDRIYSQRVPVAIDLDEEQKKLESLRRKKSELDVQTRRALEACGA